MKKILFFSFVFSFVLLFNLNFVNANTGLEVTSGVDTDKDGLIDEAELLFGTSVSNSDSDGDTYKDGAEVISSFDPNNKVGKLKFLTVKEEDVIILGDSKKLLNSFGATKRILERETQISKNELPKLSKKNKNLKTNIAINFIAYGSKSTYNLSINDRYTLLINYFTKYKKFPITVQDWNSCLSLIKELKKAKPAVDAIKPVINIDKPIIASEFNIVGENNLVIDINFDSGKDWRLVGKAGFSEGEAEFTSLAVNNKIPYVAFVDFNNGKKVTVMKFNGTIWENVGKSGFSEGEVSFTKLAFIKNVPYVAFKDFNENGKLSVMKFNGSNWENVGRPGFSSNSVSSVELVVNNNISYVAFGDDSIDKKISVMKFNGTIWENVGESVYSPGHDSNISMAFNKNVPYIAFTGAMFRATIMSLNQNSNKWEKVGLNNNTSKEGAFFTSIAFNNNTPYVAFMDQYKLLNRAAVMKFENNNWEPVGQVKNIKMNKFNGAAWVDVDIATSDFSLGISQYTSLSFANNTPYVAFRDGADEGRLEVMKLENNNWVKIGDSKKIKTGGIDYVSSIFSNNELYIAFRDVGNNKKVTVVKFSK